MSAQSIRVLIVATLAFTVFFAAWVMFGIVGIPLREHFNLSDSQFALLAALPVLTGSVMRIPIGIVTDRFGGRKVMTVLFLLTSVAAFLISHAQSYTQLLFLAVWLGLAGSSFAAGIPWVSAWCPPERQGIALGVFGTGNIGASITSMFAPILVTAIAAGGLLGGLIPGEWRFVPFIYAVLMLVMAFVTWFATPRVDRTPGQGRTLASMLRPLGMMRVWRFGYYYVTVFGAYVALSLWLPKYYVDVYDLSLAAGGLMTALFIFPASLMRPVGGLLSDHFRPRRVTVAALFVALISTLVLWISLPLAGFVTTILFLGVAMGIGMGAIFAYIPRYFPSDVGTVGGLVGALGGIGGFILPLLFARATKIFDTPHSTWYVLSTITILAIVMLMSVIIRLGPEMEEPHQSEP